MLVLQELQGRQCFRNPVQATLAGGDQVEGVPVMGLCHCKCFGSGERLAVSAALAQFADAANLDFDRHGFGSACHACPSYLMRSLSDVLSEKLYRQVTLASKVSDSMSQPTYG